MTGTDLKRLLALVRKKRIWTTPIVSCKRWVQRHQPLLRRLMTSPDEEISVRDLIHEGHIDDPDELIALGFVYIPEIEEWAHTCGDDHGVQVLIGYVDGRAERANDSARVNSMAHAFGLPTYQEEQ
jgi:hypothetical protein